MENSSENFSIGEIVWSSFGGKSRWYPSLIVELCENATFKVHYFNYNGNPGLIIRKNLIHFTDVDAFKANSKVLREKKSIIFTKKDLRSIEEAKCYKTFPEDRRLEIFETSRMLNQLHRKNLDAIMMEIDNSLTVNDDLKEQLKTLYQALKDFDERNSKQGENIKSVKRKLEVSNSLEFFNSDRLQKLKEKKDMIKEKLVNAKEEPVHFEDKEYNSIVKDEPAIVEESKQKRRKLETEITLQEKFLVEIYSPNNLFEEAPSRRVCEKCLTDIDSKTIVCNGTSCGKWMHQICFEYSNVESNFCQDCTNENIERCFSCKSTVMNDNENEIITCGKQNCFRKYHKLCLNKFYPFCKDSCPSHDCNTCKSKYSVSNAKSTVYCIKCPAAYHQDACCIPAGTKILSMTQIICPRHKGDDEKKIKIKMKNINLCFKCHKTEDTLSKCESCPRSYHKECIQTVDADNNNEFLCECITDPLPTYNSIVWSKVKNYKWWPAVVMFPWVTPLDIEKKYKKVDRQFCVRFFGTYDYYYETCEQVYRFDVNDAKFCTKSTSTNKKLNSAFKLAIKEAIEMDGVLKSAYITMSKFKKISTNKIIAPVNLRYLKKEPHQICNCKITDEQPCGQDSNCLNILSFLECDNDCPAKEKCQNKKMRLKMGVNLTVIKTEQRGYGVICNHDIYPNTFIIEYLGELINEEEHQKRANRKMLQQNGNVYFYQLDTDVIIDAEFYGNESRFINHSCEPNCISRKIYIDSIPHIGIYSTKFIPKGTELSFDYNMNLGKMCQCGSVNCKDRLKNS